MSAGEEDPLRGAICLNFVLNSMDQNQGWDGTQNGKPLNNGVFVYMVTYTDTQQQEQVLSGNVTLMK